MPPYTRHVQLPKENTMRKYRTAMECYWGEIHPYIRGRAYLYDTDAIIGALVAHTRHYATTRYYLPEITREAFNRALELCLIP